MLGVWRFSHLRGCAVRVRRLLLPALGLLLHQRQLALRRLLLTPQVLDDLRQAAAARARVPSGCLPAKAATRKSAHKHTRHPRGQFPNLALVTCRRFHSLYSGIVDHLLQYCFKL